MDRETFYRAARQFMRDALNDRDLCGDVSVVLRKGNYFAKAQEAVMEEVSFNSGTKSARKSRTRRQTVRYTDWRDEYSAQGFVVVAETGGRSGGNYMGDEAKEYVKAPERYGIEVALDAFFSKYGLDVSTVVYRSICAQARVEDEQQHEYYGNATYYRVWYVSFDHVWSALESYFSKVAEREAYVQDLEARVTRLEQLLSRVDLVELENDVRRLNRDRY